MSRKSSTLRTCSVI